MTSGATAEVEEACGSSGARMELSGARMELSGWMTMGLRSDAAGDKEAVVELLAAGSTALLPFFHGCHQESRCSRMSSTRSPSFCCNHTSC